MFRHVQVISFFLFVLCGTKGGQRFLYGKEPQDNSDKPLTERQSVTMYRGDGLQSLPAAQTFTVSKKCRLCMSNGRRSAVRENISLSTKCRDR